MAKAAEYVKINGKASIDVKALLEATGKKTIEQAFGEEVTLVVKGRIAGENKKTTKSSGTQVEIPLTFQDGLVLEKDEASDYLETMGKRRAERYEQRTGQKPLDLEAEREGRKTEKGQARGGDSRDID